MKNLERIMDWEQMILMNELKKGKELAEELRNNFDCIPSPEILVDKLLFSYEKALSMLNWNGVSSVPNQLNGSKKRKMKEKYSEKVKVGCENGMEGAVDDGFSWRKYGQKDILGSKFPRGYYRCTHRKSQGCLAVKQVQRSDEDPSVFEVIYRGTHTCVAGSEKSFKRNTKKPKFEYAVSKLEMVEAGEGFCIGSGEEFRRFPSFSFVEEGIPASFHGLLEASPATSECNYFSTTSSLNVVQTPESGLTDEIGLFQLNSDCSSVEFGFCDLDFDTNFTFGNLELQASNLEES